MAEIIIVRQAARHVSEEDAAVLRRVLFDQVDGLGEKNRKSWRRFWNGVLRLEPGELVEIITHRQRLGWYHRKHMLFESRMFEGQERFDNFDQFRNWLKVGAGHCDWVPGPKGGVFPVPRSISYAKMEQGAMEQFHADALEFVKTDHALKTLWKHLGELQRLEMVETIIANCGAYEM